MAGRHGRLALVTVVVGVLVLSVATAAMVTHQPTAVTVDDAVTTFRADRGSPSPSSSPSTDRLRSPTGPGAATGPVRTQAAPTGGGTEPAAPPDGSATGAHDQERSREPAATAQSEPSEPARTAPPPRLILPEEGVYTYDTDGGESVDTLGGTRHRYPDETTITVRHTDCGYTARWEPLRERWDEFDICRSDDRSWVRTITVYHEFQGWGERHDYVCGETATVAAAASSPGQRWQWECQADHGSMRTVVEIAGFATRQVGGATVDAVHVRIHSTMEGDTRGTREADVWYDRWSGLELEGSYDTEATVDTPVGPSRYVERFRRTLIDLQPRR